MWLIDQIERLWHRVTRLPTPILVVDEAGFSVNIEGRVLERYEWSEVGRVVAFKRDLGTVDEICLQLDIGRRVGPLELREDYDGFREFTEALERYLPRTTPNWWSRVAFPAFELCLTTVFERTGDQSDNSTSV